MALTNPEAMVLVALLAGVPATIAAVASWRNRRALRTHNGLTVGQTVDASSRTLELVQVQQHATARDVLGVHERFNRVEVKLDQVSDVVVQVDTKLDEHLAQLGGDADLANMTAWVREQMEKEPE